MCENLKQPDIKRDMDSGSYIENYTDGVSLRDSNFETNANYISIKANNVTIYGGMDNNTVKLEAANSTLYDN